MGLIWGPRLLLATLLRVLPRGLRASVLTNRVTFPLGFSAAYRADTFVFAVRIDEIGRFGDGVYGRT